MRQKRLSNGGAKRFWWGVGRTHHKRAVVAYQLDSGMMSPHAVGLASHICDENFDAVSTLTTDHYSEESRRASPVWSSANWSPTAIWQGYHP